MKKGDHCKQIDKKNELILFEIESSLRYIRNDGAMIQFSIARNTKYLHNRLSCKLILSILKYSKFLLEGT